MEIKEKITLDMLTTDSVSIKSEKYIEMDGENVAVGGICRNAYMNSPVGRQQIKDKLPLEFYSAVMAVWGSATVTADPE